MRTTIITIFLSLGFNAAMAGEVFYFGSSHSTNTNLGNRVLNFLREPSAKCERSYLDRHSVLKLNGNGLDPRHWLATNNLRDYLYRQLENKEYLGRPQTANHTPLKQVIYERGVNPQRKLVLEFGDNSTPPNMWNGFKYNLELMISELGVSPQNCMVIAPLSNSKPELQEGKREVLKQLRELRDSGKCQVFFFDDSTTGSLTLPDGVHPTPSGYNKWADQAEKALCNSSMFSNGPLVTEDTARACEQCLEGMPIDRQLRPIEAVMGQVN